VGATAPAAATVTPATAAMPMSDRAFFCSRVSAVRSSAMCRGRLARSARPMRADHPAARIRAPPRRPLRRCRIHLFTPSADYHRPPRPSRPNRGTRVQSQLDSPRRPHPSHSRAPTAPTPPHRSPGGPVRSTRSGRVTQVTNQLDHAIRSADTCASQPLDGHGVSPASCTRWCTLSGGSAGVIVVSRVPRRARGRAGPGPAIPGRRGLRRRSPQGGGGAGVGRTVRGAAGGHRAAARGRGGAGVGTSRGLEPSEQDLVLFAEVAAGRLSTDELRELVLARYHR
jgi:hypothetical protein